MSRYIYRLLVLMLVLASSAPVSFASTRQERKLVSRGNKLYTERKFVEAASLYEQALKENPSSASAMYNLGLSTIRQISNPKDTTAANAAKMDKARKALTQVAQRAKDRPGLAAKANYNLGNLEFNSEQYQNAINYYKQALRIDPADENARKNLRIAQKKLQQQNQNKDNKQDQKDRNKDQDKDKNQQDKNQPQNQNNDNRKQPQEQDINQQTAERILQAVDNKESQTRAKVNRANKGQKSVGGGRAVKRW